MVSKVLRLREKSFGFSCIAATAILLHAMGAMPAFAQEVLKVRFGEINGTLAFVPHEVAKGLGLFTKLEKEKNIRIELAGFTVGGDETRALAGGQLDMASSQYIEIAVPMALGEPLTNVLVFNNAGSTSMLMTTKHKAQKLSELKAELGRPIRVGITSFGSGSDLLARTFLSASKIPKDDYQIVPLGSLNAFFPALQQGRVDVVQASEPAGQRLADEGIGRFVVDGWDRAAVESLMGTRIQINGVHVRNEFMEKNPAAVQAIVDVMLEAMDFIRRNIDQPDRIAALLPPDIRKQVEGKEGATVLKRVLAAMSPDGCPSTSAALAVQKSLEAADLLKPTEVNWSKYQTFRFLHGACK